MVEILALFVFIIMILFLICILILTEMAFTRKDYELEIFINNKKIIDIHKKK